MASFQQPRTSPFFHPGATANTGSLAILHLSRDRLLPTFFHDPTAGTDYDEGHVINTRFGSFPHSTFIDVPWGTQVAASQVDTGSRGRRNNGGEGKKRKIEEISGVEGVDSSDKGEDASAGQRPSKLPVAAASGFVHLLPPTPETWTLSLPHRTQVVYTPDYSHILQKLRARPGSVLIEAGAGSGSFTHAAARAVFNGYASNGGNSTSPEDKSPQRRGKVYSFEYHEPRAKTLQDEINSHGLSDIVQVTHRDVYTDGFLVSQSSDPSSTSSDTTNASTSPNATAVFLDLPAPWLALPNLTRASPSPLDPKSPVHICCFLPCIEQAQKAVATLRTLGWVEICMHELAHRRIDVRRERVGIDLEGLRAVNSSPATVDEALSRLIEVENHARTRSLRDNIKKEEGDANAVGRDTQPREDGELISRAARLAKIKSVAQERKAWKEGRIVARTEPEVKTHTSYLIFAVLPMEWTKEDEERCRAKWPPARKKEMGNGHADGSKKNKKAKQGR